MENAEKAHANHETSVLHIILAYKKLESNIGLFSKRGRNMRMQLSIQDPDLMVCYIHFIMQETLFIKRNVAIRAAALSLLSF